MKQYILLLLSVFLFKVSMCQEWHSAKEPLLESHISTGYHTSIGYIDHYYEVECVYVKRGREYNGFKLALIRNGQAIDDKKTLGVFYDHNLKRVRHVDKYYFR